MLAADSRNQLPYQTKSNNATGADEQNSALYQATIDQRISDQYISSGKGARRRNTSSNMSSSSNPQAAAVKRATPSKILGDFHLTKINQVFHDF